MDKLIFSLDEPHGPGQVYVKWQPRSGELLATTGRDSAVDIFNKHGRLIEKMTLPGIVTSMAWDSEGDVLGIISLNSSAVHIWNSYTRKRVIVDTGLRDQLTCLVWCKTGQTLAIGTQRGNLTIYNHTTAKRVPVIGKHSRKITTCAWSFNNLLAVGGDDKMLSVSNMDGDTIRTTALRSEPSDIQFSDMKQDERNGKDNTISVIVGQKTLFLLNLQDPNNPIELAFQARYGHILAYRWFGDGYIMLGFSEGYFVQISTHIREVGQELFQCKNHKDFLSDITYSSALGKVASCGDNKVKIHDVANLTDVESVIAIEDDPRVERIDWNSSGQLLAVTTSNGSVKVFLTKLPNLIVSNNSKVAILTNLSQVTVYLRSLEKKAMPWVSFVIDTEIEPSFLHMGPCHVVVGVNNRAWVYALNPVVSKINSLTYRPVLIGDKEYLGTITSMLLNSNYSSAQANGRIQLNYLGEEQKTIPENFVDKESRVFPETGEKYTVSCQCLNEEYLIFSTDQQEVKIFSLSEWKLVAGYRHMQNISHIYSDQFGVNIILVDITSSAYVYHTASETLLRVPEFPTTHERVLWDSMSSDRNVFICCTSTQATTYVLMPNYYEGSKVEVVGNTLISSSQTPVLLTKGLLTLVNASNKLVDQMLETHKTSSQNPQQTLDESFKKTMKLLNFKEAWSVCVVLNSSAHWEEFAHTALKHLEFKWVRRIYQMLDNASMVWCLEEITDSEEEQEVLRGHVAALLKDHDLAETIYLQSGRAELALEMRRDLRQWKEALHLAATLDSKEIPYISCDYAQHLELIGNHAQALSYYQKCLEGLQNTNDTVCVQKCKDGLARSAIKVGDFRLGIRLATESNSNLLKTECAEILEQFNKLNDAVVLYESAGNYERAASCYIQLKNWTKIGQLLPHIKSSQTLIQYAKAREAMGNYKESAAAYERAEDYESVVRIDLDHLNDVRHAAEIVSSRKSIEGAKRMADYCMSHGDYDSAIQFLILSKCYTEAFNLAKQQKKIEAFGSFLLEEDEPNFPELKNLSAYFEAEEDFFRAAQYCYYAKEYGRAMRLLKQSERGNTDSDENLYLGVNIVADSNDEQLMEEFRELLEGKVDGRERNPKFLYRIFMNQNNYSEAARCALAVATDEASRGSYRGCHETLFNTVSELQANGLNVSNELMGGLGLIHSYLLARYHVRNSNHELAAPLLLRVAENISFFPQHAASILTSTVIECKRVNMYESALKYAAILLRPEYKNQLDERYKKQIELIVRKAPSKQNRHENVKVLPCPHCDTLLPEMTLHCSGCSRIIPFCIASGKHIIRGEITKCPECNFPAIQKYLMNIVDQEGFCPMCKKDLRSIPLPIVEGVS